MTFRSMLTEFGVTSSGRPWLRGAAIGEMTSQMWPFRGHTGGVRMYGRPELLWKRTRGGPGVRRVPV